MLSAEDNQVLQIKPVTKHNQNDVLSLSLTERQQHFIEPVAACLQEADALSLWRPVGLYYNGTPIGFAMYGAFSDKRGTRVWLDRFLIGHAYQGKGFGKLALRLLIQRLRGEYGCHNIYLSLYPDNAVALSLYQQFGFVPIPEKDINGEQVMVLSL